MRAITHLGASFFVLALVVSTLGCDPGSGPPTGVAPDGGAGSPDAAEESADDGSSIPPPVVEEPGEPEAPLAIGTWNLEAFPRHPDTIAEVARLVESLSLDVVGIQEITEPEPFEALADAMPDHDMVVSFDSRTFTRVGFLYRPDRIEVSEISLLFRDDRYAFPRSPLAAELTVRADDGTVVFDFTFVVVHLKAMPDEESRQRRMSAVRQLDAWVRDRMLTEPDVIVVGDYNDQATDPADENVFGPFLDAPDTYRMLTLEGERAGARSYIPFRSNLDHVVVTVDALGEYGDGTTDVMNIDIGMSTYRDVVSDHRPVVARFELPLPR